jgi:hypothetical protein
VLGVLGGSALVLSEFICVYLRLDLLLILSAFIGG